jgi:hypothetical protein
MSHIDTLEVYKEYLSLGYSNAQAETHAKILEKSFMNKVNELKYDFVSNKNMNLIAGLIVVTLTAISGELWYLSKEVSILSRDMKELRQYIFEKH